MTLSFCQLHSKKGLIIWVTFVLNLVLVKWCTFPFLKEQNCQTMWAYALVITARGSLTLAAFIGFVPHLVLKFIPNFILNFIPNFVLNFVLNFVPNFVPNFVLNFVPNFVPNFVLNFVPNFVLRTDLQTDKAPSISDSLRRRLKRPY